LIERFNLSRWAIGLIAGLVAMVATIGFYLIVSRSADGDITIEDDPRSAEIAVEIRGEVQSPGVYRFSGDARLADVITAAGGTLDGADLAQLNLAKRVEDESVIIIPAWGAATPVLALASPVGTVTAFGISGRIDINRASQAELESLPGIGKVLAERIIAYRTAHGPFQSVQALDAVDGISAGLIADIEPLITTEP
jgi:competence protein ComEA